MSLVFDLDLCSFNDIWLLINLFEFRLYNKVLDLFIDSYFMERLKNAMHLDLLWVRFVIEHLKHRILRFKL